MPAADSAYFNSATWFAKPEYSQNARARRSQATP